MFKRIDHIDHIELLTAFPDRTINFYTGALGFHVRERQRIAETPLGPLDLVYLELGGTTLEVMHYPEATAIPARSIEQRLGWQCLALEVADMDAALALLRNMGVHATWGPLTRPEYARAEIRDPDGNPIELRQWVRPHGHQTPAQGRSLLPESMVGKTSNKVAATDVIWEFFQKHGRSVSDGNAVQQGAPAGAVKPSR